MIFRILGTISIVAGMILLFCGVMTAVDGSHGYALPCIIYSIAMIVNAFVLYYIADICDRIVQIARHTYKSAAYLKETSHTLNEINTRLSNCLKNVNGTSCGQEHKQLTEWLKERNVYKENS